MRTRDNVGDFLPSPDRKAYRVRTSRSNVSQVYLIRRLCQHVLTELRRLGHEVETIDAWSWSVGSGQGIWRNPHTGVLCGSAGPRRDGYAVGF